MKSIDIHIMSERPIDAVRKCEGQTYLQGMREEVGYKVETSSQVVG